MNKDERKEIEEWKRKVKTKADKELKIDEGKEEAKIRAAKEGREWTANDEVMWSPETFQAISDAVGNRNTEITGSHENIGFFILLFIVVIMLLLVFLK